MNPSKLHIPVDNRVSTTALWCGHCGVVLDNVGLWIIMLHIARKILRNGFSDTLNDILSTILERNFNQCYSVLSLHESELNTSELVELQQKSAVEHLTTYRQLMARDWFCSHDCHNRLWGTVPVQTWWLSAVFTTVYTERTHAIVCSSPFQNYVISGVYSAVWWRHCFTDCTNANGESWI